MELKSDPGPEPCSASDFSNQRPSRFSYLTPSSVRVSVRSVVPGMAIVIVWWLFWPSICDVPVNAYVAVPNVISPSTEASALNGSRSALRNKAGTSVLGAADIRPIAPPPAVPADPLASGSTPVDGDAVATGEAGPVEPFGEPVVGAQAAMTATRPRTSTVVAMVREGCVRFI